MGMDGRVIFYAFVGMAFGLLSFYKGIKWMRQKRLIENIPTSKIRSLAMGLAEVFGEALPAGKEILKSPFSGKDCVYYRYTVEEYRSSGKHRSWATIDKGNSRERFFLKDSTGQVLVDPDGAKVDIPMDFEYRPSGKIPERIKEFAEKSGLRYKNVLGFNKNMRFREYFIQPGENVYILGTAGDNPFVEEGTAKHGMEDVMIQKGRDEKRWYIEVPMSKPQIPPLIAFTESAAWRLWW